MKMLGANTTGEGGERAALAAEIIRLATRPSQVALDLLSPGGDAAELAAELEDVANRFLDISENLIAARLNPAG